MFNWRKRKYIEVKQDDNLIVIFNRAFLISVHTTISHGIFKKVKIRLRESYPIEITFKSEEEAIRCIDDIKTQIEEKKHKE